MAAASDPDLRLRQAFPWGAVVERSGAPAVLMMDLAAVPDPVSSDTVEVRVIGAPSDTVGRCALGDLDDAAVSGQLSLGDRVMRRPEAADAALLAEPFQTLIGWQSRSDASWVARMRLHQSWYRTFRLRLPFGAGPGEEPAGEYGNLLTKASAEQGRNFTSEVAHEEYRKRVADGRPGVHPWRTTRNLLASQPMAFNLFGPLVADPGLASAVLRQIVPDVDEVIRGEIEHPSDALGDRTAFDAYFEYRTSDGVTRCIAIETKLTEPFSQAEYDWSHYLNHSAFATSVWNTADPKVLGNLRWSQLWRNHLLARAESDQHGFGEPTVLVVHHPQDLACPKTVDGYRRLLHDQNRCRAVDVATVLAAIRTAAEPAGEPAWVDEFADRYLRLGLSAPLTKLHGVRYEAEAGRLGLL